MLKSGRGDKTRINWEIREREIRLIDSEGNHQGVTTVEQAIKIAAEAGLDLVEVATKSQPHVCRIMDFGQYKYEQAKKQKQARNRQKTITVKEIKIRPNISEHDIQVKVRNMERFVKDGDKVRVVVMFRSREIAHPEIGNILFQKILDSLGAFAQVDSNPMMEGRNLVMVLGPKSSK